INVVKENLDVYYSKVYMDHLLGVNLSSNKKGFRIGCGIKCILTSRLYMNFIFRYHIFINDYKHIKFLNKNLIDTGFQFIYKF
ncbi:MAG: hypothetical protein Q8O27_00010, partial [Enterobacteriaceae bacterium]|nr:hypothetical protein [Enterobacteriaceae bacterium]